MPGSRICYAALSAADTILQKDQHMSERKIFEPEKLEKKLIALGETEMQLFK